MLEQKGLDLCGLFTKTKLLEPLDGLFIETRLVNPLEGFLTKTRLLKSLDVLLHPVHDACPRSTLPNIQYFAGVAKEGENILDSSGKIL